MVINYLKILCFIAVVYLSILSCFAFNNYESMHLKKTKSYEIGFSLFYAAIFYFLLFLFISFYLNKKNKEINNINNQIIEMKENLIIDEENQILN
jgi:asparagine N-glycosylation enzyme membrane subunit Stt3